MQYLNVDVLKFLMSFLVEMPKLDAFVLLCLLTKEVSKYHDFGKPMSPPPFLHFYNFHYNTLKYKEITTW